MKFVKKVTKHQLFLPLFSMVLVMLVNIIYDVANGNAVFNFFTISINNGILYGRLIDILNRGSEAAILALGMTLGSSPPPPVRISRWARSCRWRAACAACSWPGLATSTSPSTPSPCGWAFWPAFWWRACAARSTAFWWPGSRSSPWSQR